MSPQPCNLCPGGCEGADLAPLLVPDLLWFWQQLAAAAEAGRENPVDAYAQAVLEGSVPAGKYHRLACARHLRDRAREGTADRAATPHQVVHQPCRRRQVFGRTRRRRRQQHRQQAAKAELARKRHGTARSRVTRQN